MESKTINLTSPNKNKEIKINPLYSTPKWSKQKKIILPIKSNNNPYLKAFFSNKKTISLPNEQNSNISKNCFLIPQTIQSISKLNSKLNNSFSYINKTEIKQKKIFNSQYFTESKNIFHKNMLKFNFSEIKPEQNKLTQISLLHKKRKYMTSEEIELENIEKERNTLKKLMEKNKNLYLKSLIYSPIDIIPKPLTTFKPFKLSSNNNSKYLKEGKSNTIFETNKLNQKIRLKMKQKIEALTDKKTKNQILLNNFEYLKKQNILYNDLFKIKKNNNNIDINDNNNNNNNKINFNHYKNKIINYLNEK